MKTRTSGLHYRIEQLMHHVVHHLIHSPPVFLTHIPLPLRALQEHQLDVLDEKGGKGGLVSCLHRQMLSFVVFGRLDARHFKWGMWKRRKVQTLSSLKSRLFAAKTNLAGKRGLVRTRKTQAPATGDATGNATGDTAGTGALNSAPNGNAGNKTGKESDKVDTQEGKVDTKEEAADKKRSTVSLATSSLMGTVRQNLAQKQTASSNSSGSNGVKHDGTGNANGGTNPVAGKKNGLNVFGLSKSGNAPVGSVRKTVIGPNAGISESEPVDNSLSGLLNQLSETLISGADALLLLLFILKYHSLRQSAYFSGAERLIDDEQRVAQWEREDQELEQRKLDKGKRRSRRSRRSRRRSDTSELSGSDGLEISSDDDNENFGDGDGDFRSSSECCSDDEDDDELNGNTSYKSKKSSNDPRLSISKLETEQEEYRPPSSRMFFGTGNSGERTANSANGRVSLGGSPGVLRGRDVSGADDDDDGDEYGRMLAEMTGGLSVKSDLRNGAKNEKKRNTTGAAGAYVEGAGESKSHKDGRESESDDEKKCRGARKKNRHTVAALSRNHEEVIESMLGSQDQNTTDISATLKVAPPALNDTSNDGISGGEHTLNDSNGNADNSVSPVGSKGKNGNSNGNNNASPNKAVERQAEDMLRKLYGVDKKIAAGKRPSQGQLRGAPGALTGQRTAASVSPGGKTAGSGANGNGKSSDRKSSPGGKSSPRRPVTKIKSLQRAAALRAGKMTNCTNRGRSPLGGRAAMPIVIRGDGKSGEMTDRGDAGAHRSQSHGNQRAETYYLPDAEKEDIIARRNILHILDLDEKRLEEAAEKMESEKRRKEEERRWELDRRRREYVKKEEKKKEAKKEREMAERKRREEEESGQSPNESATCGNPATSPHAVGMTSQKDGVPGIGNTNSVHNFLKLQTSEQKKSSPTRVAAGAADGADGGGMVFTDASTTALVVVDNQGTRGHGAKRQSPCRKKDGTKNGSPTKPTSPRKTTTSPSASKNANTKNASNNTNNNTKNETTRDTTNYDPKSPSKRTKQCKIFFREFEEILEHCPIDWRALIANETWANASLNEVRQ